MKSILLLTAFLVASFNISAASLTISTTSAFYNPVIGQNSFFENVNVLNNVSASAFRVRESMFSSNGYLNVFSGPTNQSVPPIFLQSSLPYTFGFLNSQVIGSSFTSLESAWSNLQMTSIDLSVQTNVTTPDGNSTLFTNDFRLTKAFSNDDPSQTIFNISLIDSAPDVFFQYEGISYTLQMLGFLSSNGSYDQLIPNLNNQNFAHAFLRGVFTPSEVPLPAAFWLFGSGIVGFMAIRRRAKQKT